MFKAAVIGDPVRISWSNREKRCAWTTAERCGFYRAMHFSAKRGIAIACRLSVCPSLCLSVCL